MQPLAFVDLETTGATSSADRITEIGIVTVDADGAVAEWQQLVNPGVPIAPFIENLTGISNRMVASAPPFAAVADETLRRLQGRLFVAHNARFDHGFLKHEFKRAGVHFKGPALCTVKLSRALYPEHQRHSLDALIERHGLRAAARHRALADAQLIHQFWQIAHRERSPEQIAAAIAAQNPPCVLPPQIDPALADDLPETPGVFVLHDATDKVLWIGARGNNAPPAPAGGGSGCSASSGTKPPARSARACSKRGCAPCRRPACNGPGAAVAARHRAGPLPARPCCANFPPCIWSISGAIWARRKRRMPSPPCSPPPAPASTPTFTPS